MKNVIINKNQQLLIRVYAAAAVSCYYWYRIPALFGFEVFGDGGMLVNLTNYISPYTIYGIIISTTIFFFWWIV